MSNPTAQYQDLTFECRHEIRPPLSPETQQLYLYALYHDLHNMWNGKKGDEIWQKMATLYRIAAYNGDYKANLRLQWLIETGRVAVKKPQTEVYLLNKELEKQLPATAMYKLYYHLDSRYGVSTKPGGQFAYLRKAADMGSREAQYELGEMLINIQDKSSYPVRKALREQLLACSAAQGNGDAAKWLGIRFQAEQKYSDAVKMFHQGAKNGNIPSAFSLWSGFLPDAKKNKEYIGVTSDLERSKRYHIIYNFLSDYEFLQPKVPDLDDIVPLPPAKLPAWDGKIAFQRWYEGSLPTKPADELIQKLAQKAGLDWQTGLPIKK
ncbi:hypothetical protein RO21_01210 [[Actinobacillus] muris]|uniref:DUF6396 domain-containing protein n=1 Tax=Muribacter muris TaxID=67855 RepID=A0A0J5P9J5_9PAST|nr:DUF6396 domain-containing protein [Muribacter muris]KMK52390.1 hypothetical protein RO21_01210 [[Actinobacillus] muris] [Muribacter muris]